MGGSSAVAPAISLACLMSMSRSTNTEIELGWLSVLQQIGTGWGVGLITSVAGVEWSCNMAQLARVAQWIAHQTSNLGVLGSSPSSSRCLPT